MSLVQRLMSAFEGSDAGHGRTVLGRTSRTTGKTEAESRVIREPLTQDKIQAHIDGKVGVGAIPINADNQCKFGALDIDTYDLDIVQLNAKVQKMGLPLILCRSKSGGAHLYLFLKEWEPAALVREYLAEMASALGFSGCEIFPKQDKVLTERGDVGNFINMPYFGGDITTRYALDSNGESLSLEEFLDLVDKKRTTAAKLDKLQFAGERKHFTDGPYCLEVMASQGPITTNRNIFMFNVGVYCRLKWPDDWKRHHEEYNRLLCHPALDAGEIVDLQKSLDKNAKYFYQCDQCPLKDFCNKNICRTRPHGVGNGTSDLPEINGMTIMLSEPRIYFLNVGEDRLQLNVEQLQAPHLFQRACMSQLQFMPPLPKSAQWQGLINNLMSEAVIVEVPEELTLSGQFRDHLRSYCTGRVQAMSPEEIKMGKPWTDKGLTMFTMAGLDTYLKNRGFHDYSRPQIQEEIKKINNDGSDGNKTLMIKGGPKGRTSVRVWYVPEFEDTEVELEVKESDYDSPF